MNEEQADKLIRVLENIETKLSVVIPKNAMDEEAYKYNMRFKVRMRDKLYPTLSKEQRELFMQIEKDAKEGRL
jgi:hypothetical protein